MTSLSKLLASLTKPTPMRTAADLRADLAKVDLPALEAKVAEIERERRGLLLRGTDADLAKNRQALDAASLDAERGQAAVEELSRLIAEAEAREGAAEMEAQAAGAQKAVDDLAIIYARIDEVTNELNELFAQAKPLAARIDSWNQRGHKLGRPRLMYSTVDSIRERTIGSIRR